METYIFCACVTVDHKVKSMKKVIDRCPSQEHAIKLGKTMCGQDCIVVYCVPATVQNLVDYIRDYEVERNADEFDRTSKLISRFEPPRSRGRKGNVLVGS